MAYRSKRVHFIPLCSLTNLKYKISKKSVVMEMLSPLFLSFFFSVCLAFFFLAGKPKKRKLPPGPFVIPILGNLLWLNSTLFNTEPILRRLRTQYGPIITLPIGSRTSIFISDHSIAHQTLITRGSDFADRPPSTSVGRIFNANQHNISSAEYGPLWRLLRRNLMSEILHPSRIKSYAKGRSWILEFLIQKLKSESESSKGVSVLASFQYAIFCLLLLMCFGKKLDEEVVRDVEVANRRTLSLARFNILAFFPRIGKLVFRKRWNEMVGARRRQIDVILPLIRARKENQMKGQQETDEKSFPFAYVDSLFQLELPEEGGRKLTEVEMVTLCSEFLNAGAESTSSALQWVLGNLVKHPEIQEKLAQEIERVVEERKGQGKEGDDQDFVREEDLQKMTYLKAVVMETLRRHPPSRFVLRHPVKEEMEINGYVIPKDASINFMVAEMGLDEKVWEDPVEFKPERFLKKDVDITGSREIKMIPFGAGRRMCPGMSLAMLHLEWFVANLVREFAWKGPEGEEVDISEKPELAMAMKNPLKVVLVPRRKTDA